VSQSPDPPLRIDHHISDVAVLVTLAGELDLLSSPLLDACVDELRPLTRPLRLDVAEVPFVDSTGLRALVSARRASIEDTGQPLTLVGSSAGLRELLTLMGLSDLFPDSGD
jgi:anti-anti-sigma factor